MTKILSFFLLLVITYSCSERRNKNNNSEYLDNQSRPVIETFFNNIGDGKIDIALENLLSRNENIDLQDSATINLKNKFETIYKYSGKFIGKKLIRQKNLNDDLGIYVYLVKFEKKFYRFIFTFYNNGTQTKIYKFSFDDTIDSELEESIKLYIN